MRSIGDRPRGHTAGGGDVGYMGFGSFCKPNLIVLGLRGNLVFIQNYILSLLVVILIMRKKTIFSGEEEDKFCPET